MLNIVLIPHNLNLDMEKSDHSWSITGEAVRNTHSFEVKREKIIEFNRTNKLNILL